MLFGKKYGWAVVMLAGFWSALATAAAVAQSFDHAQLVQFAPPAAGSGFALIQDGKAAPILLADDEADALGAAVQAFASDVERVTGLRPAVLTHRPNPMPQRIILVGTTNAPPIKLLASRHLLPVERISGRWEAAITTVLDKPAPGLQQALVVAGSDRRGTAYALFELSRQMGVSPWIWWADVPVAHHQQVYVTAHDQLQNEPSVPYRGIFLNDEDWGIRPWAAKMMDPEQKNFGPHTYEKIFELLLRLHANSLWPAMHPGTLPFNAVAENARLADRWAIVMGASHSEALLRNNVGEWDEKIDGPWNYQTNKTAIDAYWKHRLEVNGKYENFYTIGMRGVHDTGLEATGTVDVKARLVEQVMASQQQMLATLVNPDLNKIPQVIWLYKESLELYRAGMKVPDDVTLGWTDDNYGYIRQLPTVEEQKRKGGSAVYYHVSYWGFPHDYLWLCSTPPAMLREELTKAYDHNARRYWVLNVGDIKPAEADIDYFMQLGWNEPAMAKIEQHEFLQNWFHEQFPTADSSALASVMNEYYRLNFIRRPEFMGFNGYNDAVKHTEFNPLAWSNTTNSADANNQNTPWGQNGARIEEWQNLVEQEQRIAKTIPANAQSAFFELVGYPVETSAAINRKFLFTDRTFVDVHQSHNSNADASAAQAAYTAIQELTKRYNQLENGKWEGMMSSAPRERQVFRNTTPATSQDAATALPEGWAPHAPTPAAISAKPGPFTEDRSTISINAAQYARHSDGTLAAWHVMDDLGLVETKSMVYGQPGLLANLPLQSMEENAPWLEYEFTTASTGAAKLAIFVLPTFPVDSAHKLRFKVALDGVEAKILDQAGAGEWKEDSAPTWEKNVLRSAAVFTVPAEVKSAGKHTVRITELDPGLVLEHLQLSFPGAAPAYPFAPQTGSAR